MKKTKKSTDIFFIGYIIIFILMMITNYINNPMTMSIVWIGSLLKLYVSKRYSVSATSCFLAMVCLTVVADGFFNPHYIAELGEFMYFWFILIAFKIDNKATVYEDEDSKSKRILKTIGFTIVSSIVLAFILHFNHWLSHYDTLDEMDHYINHHGYQRWK